MNLDAVSTQVDEELDLHSDKVIILLLIFAVLCS